MHAPSAKPGGVAASMGAFGAPDSSSILDRAIHKSNRVISFVATAKRHEAATTNANIS